MGAKTSSRLIIRDNLEKGFEDLKEYSRRLKSDELIGITSGFKRLDSTVGRIEEGAIWIIGGYSGTGKSFFVLNLVDGIIAEAIEHKNEENYSIPKVCIFSTELSVSGYMKRHICMREGIWMTTMQNYRDPELIDRFEKRKDEYIQERRLNPTIPAIIGDIGSYEQIEESLNSMKNKPDLIIIDYIQELSVKDNGKTLNQEDDAVPVIAAKLLRLARDRKIGVIAISQINNYMVNSDSKTNKLVPFSHGKQLNQAADVSIVLNRERKGSKLSPVLEAIIMKSRHGDYGTVPFLINSGYNLEELSKERAEEEIEKFNMLS